MAWDIPNGGGHPKILYFSMTVYATYVFAIGTDKRA